ncbi:MAG: L,D-transpeptidase family protein [Acidimicrobiia bacterium]|nr:L,D-transpeptidase family protein [Acidimicrobiia bacterium]
MPGAGLIDATEDVADPASGDILPARGRGQRSRVAMYVALALAGLSVLGVAAGVAWSRHSSHRAAARVPAPPLLTVDPPDGATGVRPDAKITVQASRGRLLAVHVIDSGGNEVAGALAPLSHSWTSTGSLYLARGYKVTADITGVSKSKRPVVRTSEFETIRPAGLLGPQISPGDNETVGVGQPIIIRFHSPVANRDAITPLLTVSVSKPVDGAWHWFGPKEVHYRPQGYWPSGEQISVVAKLTNVEAGNNIWGEVDRTVNFKIGDTHISTVDTDSHTMTVTSNGATLRTLPISAGRDKYPTMSGVHITLGKSYHVVMDSSTVGIPVNSPDGYREDVYWNVAVTDGGEYVHAAPWSVGAQGNRNVSHGCVNLSPADATWFYNFSLPGDVVNIVGSSRGPSATDPGTMDWNMPWSQWVQPVA